MSHVKRAQHSWPRERENAGNSEVIENPFIKIYLDKGKDEQLFRQEAILKDFFEEWGNFSSIFDRPWAQQMLELTCPDVLFL